MGTSAPFGGTDPFMTSLEAAAGTKPHYMTSSQAKVGLCYNETLSPLLPDAHRYLDREEEDRWGRKDYKEKDQEVLGEK